MADAKKQHVCGFVVSCGSSDQIARIQTWILAEFGPYTIEYASASSHNIFMQFKLCTPTRNALVEKMTRFDPRKREDILDHIAPWDRQPVFNNADVSAIYVNAAESNPRMPPKYEPPHSQ
jgi:hypothetical protein